MSYPPLSVSFEMLIATFLLIRAGLKNFQDCTQGRP